MIELQPNCLFRYANLACWLLLFFLASMVGCKESGPLLHPVVGRVNFTNGDPVRNASIEFVPKTAGRSPRGQIDEQGRFQLSTYDQDDGAPAGEYHVVVVQALPPNARELMRSLGNEHTEHAAHAHQPVQVVSLKHAGIETTGLTQTVSAEVANNPVTIVVEPQ